MPLRDLPTKASLNTSTHELLTEFVVPALARSTRYDRGVGYFTSHWLKLAASGLAGMAANGGRGRIIASPKLSEEDVAALIKGEEARLEPALAESLRRAFNDLESDLEKDTLGALAWMVADGLLDFRIAVPVGELDGDFHDKFGIFGDGKDAVAFRGSPNDSERAFRNYESISIYYSWLDSREAERVRDEQERFDRIWENRDANLRVYDLPAAIRRDLLEYTKRFGRPYGRAPTGTGDEDRWRHQREAVAEFLAARRGVLEMATGTGKTRTALTILTELHARGLVRAAIVTAYGTDLLDQWYAELLKRTRFPVYRAYGGHRESLSFMNAHDDAVLLVSRQNFAELIGKLDSGVMHQTLLVCDEVHGMGSPALVRALAGNLDAFAYRLGLSATPERAYDEDGNRFVETNIGPVVYRFTLDQAIRRGILCEFDYVDLEYEFSEEDRQAVRLAIKRHHASASSPNPSPVEQLYQELARVRKLSKQKLQPFRTYVTARPEVLRRCLIFVETAEYGALVQNILMDLGVDYHTYYGDDDRVNLQRFASGELDCLVTCKRISEGIDISSVGSVVLFASARALLETVQRLGRCLRVDPADPSKRAFVLDFIRTDDLGEDETDPESTADADRREWFRRLSQVRTEHCKTETAK